MPGGMKKATMKGTIRRLNHWLVREFLRLSISLAV